MIRKFFEWLEKPLDPRLGMIGDVIAVGVLLGILIWSMGSLHTFLTFLFTCAGVCGVLWAFDKMNRR